MNEWLWNTYIYSADSYCHSSYTDAGLEENVHCFWKAGSFGMIMNTFPGVIGCFWYKKKSGRIYFSSHGANMQSQNQDRLHSQHVTYEKTSKSKKA